MSWREVESRAEAEQIVKNCRVHWVPAAAEWDDLIRTKFIRATKADLRQLLSAWFNSDNTGEEHGVAPTLRVNTQVGGEARWLPHR